MTDLDAFRTQTRAWLSENCPAEMRDGPDGEDKICWGGQRWTFKSDAQRIWLERMAAKGWTVPTWPEEYGGAGLGPEEAKILAQELALIDARIPLGSFGIWMLGPALLRYGTHEQKLHFLPPIARGEIRWCQGYSEPNAGSDLVSLQCRCEDKGDHWLVNGQKVWTSYADEADWIFTLVRTDPASKHQGISFLLIDMAQEGVSTRPIKLISGKSPFCETFFDDVVVPKEYGAGISSIVGTVDRGWDVAKYLLTHEREMISDGGGGAFGGPGLAEFAIGRIGVSGGRLSDPMVRAKIAQLELDTRAFGLTVDRLRDESARGRDMGANSSMLKYYGTELNKRRFELLMDIGGADAVEWDSDLEDAAGLAATWLRSKGNSIEGGTSEIQLNVIAKRVLGLPSA
ncbi:MAG TPA: acyl-CoA dehydrogenase family protein [Allosphingosinicella sp.]|nr:acyl-CoA dehydrogenase family protein [Allosphingosinicella sp.]